MKLFYSLVVILLMTCNLSAQYGGGKLIDDAFNEIRREAVQRGIDIDDVIQRATFNGYPLKFKGVTVVDTIDDHKLKINPSALTTYQPHYRFYISKIQIERDNMQDRNVLISMIAHELGHVLLGPTHEPKKVQDRIMSGITISGSGDLYDRIYKSEYVSKRWDIYFDKIRTKYYAIPGNYKVTTL